MQFEFKGENSAFTVLFTNISQPKIVDIFMHQVLLNEHLSAELFNSLKGCGFVFQTQYSSLLFYLIDLTLKIVNSDDRYVLHIVLKYYKYLCIIDLNTSKRAQSGRHTPMVIYIY